MPRYMPKTLAKTLSYILYHSPGEYGLFWNADGTMPWKEFYWALQEDPSLRFVRQNHLQELDYLQIELPAKLEGNSLLLNEGFPLPDYPLAEHLPDRLFYACPRKQLGAAMKRGLLPTSRPYLPITADKELAFRLGKRRDAQPVLVEIDAQKACTDGIAFRAAGSGLYLVESLTIDYLWFPPVREERLIRFTGKKKEKAGTRSEDISSPGSFIANVDHFRAAVGSTEGSPSGEKRKGRAGRKGPEWKREARKGKDRLKRRV